MTERLGAWTDATIARLHRLAGELPTTGWVPLTGTVTGLLTAVVYLVSIMMKRPPEPVTFGMWLGFVASWIGFGVRQFRIKRETHDEYVRSKNRPSTPTPAPAA